MSPPEQPSGSAPSAPAGRTGSDEPIGRILLVAAVLLVVVLASVAVSRLLLHVFGAPESAKPLAVTPAARLQAQPATRYEQFLHDKRGARDSYGWIDRGSGVAHIPVARAMALLAGRADAKSAPDRARSGAGS